MSASRPRAARGGRAGHPATSAAPKPAASIVAAPALPEWHMAALLVGYRIATHQPRDREAWRRALDEAGLEPEARKVAADYLQGRWRAAPYDPDLFKQGEVYGKGLKPQGVFTCRDGDTGTAW